MVNENVFLLKFKLSNKTKIFGITNVDQFIILFNWSKISHYKHNTKSELQQNNSIPLAKFNPNDDDDDYRLKTLIKLYRYITFQFC